MKRHHFTLFLILFINTILHAQGVASLFNQASLLLDANQPKKTVAIYESILQKEPKNYDALVYLANYHYNLGQSVLDSVELDFKNKRPLNSMHNAEYEKNLHKVYESYFKISEAYLVCAYLIKPNDYLDKIAGDLAVFKNRIGLKTPQLKPLPFLKRRLL